MARLGLHERRLRPLSGLSSRQTRDNPSSQYRLGYRFGAASCEQREISVVPNSFRAPPRLIPELSTIAFTPQKRVD
jgi:hypothetical protein